MATVLPSRPNTNSTGGSSNSNSNSAPARRPSLSSFPSNLSAPHSAHTDLSNRLPNPSNASANPPSSAHSTAPDMAAARHKAIHSPRAIKSQYPANSGEKHVEYILVASFDIDRGSVMEHQYPGPVGGDEVMLAELMLPDQTHLRSQDWTIFFLHKDAEAEDEEEGGKGGRKGRRKRRRKGEGDGQAEGGPEEGEDREEEEEEEEYGEESSDEEPMNLDGPPLVYVLNLVNTKQDNTVKRGAIVKAMAICTRHSFLHIYKPLLLLALEQYFASPTIETLASLYDAVNGMDLSLMPRLSLHEKFILQASDAKDLFVEKFEAIIAQRMAASASESASQTSASPTALQQHPSRSRYGLPRDTHEFESVVHYANVPVPVKVPVALSAETVGDFSLIKLITTFATPHASSPVPFNPTHPHLTTSGPSTHPIIVLLNALLTQKRVIFLGYNLPSSEVAEAVLAACALASGGLLRGFTRHAFPYTDLTKIDDLLKVPGFIAGVTNPAFAHKTEWWDVLCDISTGRMRISNRVEPAPLTEGVAFFNANPLSPPPSSSTGAPASSTGISALGSSISTSLGGAGGGGSHPSSSHSHSTAYSHNAPAGFDPTGDAAFIAAVLSAIHERHGEPAIRTKFRLWISKFTRLAASFEEAVYGASALGIHSPTTAPSSATSPPGTPFSPTRSFPDALSPTTSAAAPEWSPEVQGHGYVWPTPAHRSAELAANAHRIEGWRSTRSYYNFVQDLAAYYPSQPIRSLDLAHLCDRLAKHRLSIHTSAAIYLALARIINTEAEVSQLLATLANGDWEGRVGSAGCGQGLFYLAMGLFHADKGVRGEVWGLLERIRGHEAGRVFWSVLGRFAKGAWERVGLEIGTGEVEG